MKFSKFLRSLTVALIIQLAASYAAASDHDYSAKWTQIHHGSTIVIRPTRVRHARQDHQDPLAPKAIRIVGYRSIADFVNEALGFSASTVGKAVRLR